MNLKLLLLLPVVLVNLANANCSQLFSLFFKSNQLNQNLETILKNSPSTQALNKRIPNITNQVYATQELIPRKSAIREELTLSLGREPKVSEIIVAIHDDYQKTLLPRLRELGQKDPLLDQYYQATEHVLEKRFKHLDSAVRKSPEIYDVPFDPLIDEHNQAVASYLSHAYGEIGEMISATRIPNILSHGQHFDSNFFGGKKIGEIIQEKILLAEKKLRYGNAEELAESYPTIFHLKSNRGHRLEPQEVLKRAIDWLQTKEIDLISHDGNGKMIWTEVKNYSNGIDMGSFKGHYPNSKSIEHQLRSYLEIIRFLDIEDQVQIAVHFEAGMTSEVRNYIKAMGIKIL